LQADAEGLIAMDQAIHTTSDHFHAKATDPVCGMTVDLAASPHHHLYRGHDYAFCCDGCRRKFAADPGNYLKNSAGDRAAARKSGDPSAVYICPMHPEVRQIGPGSCPICGMALEPEAGGTDDGGELRDMSRRFWIAAVLTAPLVALDMTAHLFGHALLPHNIAIGIELALATPVVLWGGWPFFRRGAQSLTTRNLNMFTLIAMSTSVAYCYSVVAALAPQWFPAAFRDAQGAVALYFEAAAVITVLVLLGQVLELRARASTSGAIRALMQLAPPTARLIAKDGTETDVPLDTVNVGDQLRVRPGERVPVDGAILEGNAAIDESTITGEAMPVDKAAGARVIGGTLTRSGSFIMRAEKVGGDTMLAHIVETVAVAQRSRAPIARLADQVSAWFVPAVVAAAVAAFAAWAIFGPEPRMSFALVAAVTVLIIACPCALGLATPMSIMVGIGRAAQSGILVKDATVLERMEKIDTLVVDKTGTLTQGRPTVAAIVPAVEFDETTVLRVAANVERGSEHPLAAAVVAEADRRGLASARVLGFNAIPGKGVIGMVERRRVTLGTAAFLNELGIASADLEREAARLRAEGATAVFVAIDGKPAGLIAIADPIKPTARAALDALRAEGIAIVMLTGDNRTTAQSVAARLGITAVEAEILPERKSAVIEELRRSGHVVAMAGDGVNDAPALTAADVGIAMGSGTDIAMASAGVTLVKGDLIGILRARRLSVAVMHNIRQNLLFAFLYNTAGVPIAAGVLFPVLGILLSPAIGAAAMSLSSVSVITNALRLRRLALD
jgi:Cu+-exporting ATPase